MLKTRPATTEDLQFVRASWFESYRHGGKAPSCGYDIYSRGQSFLIRQLTDKNSVVVAFHPDQPDEICGWVCFQPAAIHYLYVKHAYRRLGIGLQLAQLAAPQIHTHETRGGMRLAAKVGSRFDPYLLTIPSGDYQHGKG